MYLPVPSVHDEDFNSQQRINSQIPLPANFLTLPNTLQLPTQNFTIGIGDTAHDAGRGGDIPSATRKRVDGLDLDMRLTNEED